MLGIGLSRGGLQVVLCKMARARWGGPGKSSLHRGESSNNRSRTVGQTWPIPTLHPSSPHCPAAPSPTIAHNVQPSRRPGSSTVSLPFVSPPLLPCPDRTARASVRPQLLQIAPPPGTCGAGLGPAQAGPPSRLQISAKHVQALGGLQSSQSLGNHSCTSSRSWAPSSRYAAALSAVGLARHPTSRPVHPFGCATHPS